MLFIDFEASDFTGFPIEVGFSKVNKNKEVETHSKIIYYQGWLDDIARWNPSSEKIHNISKQQIINEGETPSIVMAWLNEQLGTGVVFSDNPYHDTSWLLELSNIARIEPTFLIHDMRIALSGSEIDHIATKQEVNMVAQHTHRAGDDSAELAFWYIMSMRNDGNVKRMYYENRTFIMRDL